ncbi:MAG: hypothetical protein HOY79_28935 [Streptomyces sp.]|nr:hypothetical protein [Streptomyces sp.]
MSIHNGSYRPNVKGATSLRDARPLYVGNDRVTVEVYPWEGGQWITIFVGCKAAFEGPIPAGIEYDAEFYAFIHESVEAFAAKRAEAAKAEPVKTVTRKQGRRTMSEYETRFGFIYANFTTIGQAAHEARVSVYIDDATRRPHTWGSFCVALADQAPESVAVALRAATERMGREYGIAGMTWNPTYEGYRGVQWYPDTRRPVNGRVLRDSIAIPAVRRPAHAKAAR